MFKPMREHVLIEPFPPEEKTKGGIWIPEIAQEKPRKAKVIAVGGGWVGAYDGKPLPKGFVKKLAVKRGDIVLIGSNLKGIDLKLKGKNYELIRENFIFGVLK